MTAVEFLSEQMRLTNIEGLRIKLWDAIEQAKEMEKEQIINAFECVDLDEDYRGEQYYNETFKSK